jgi:hypothetical protein
MKLVARARETNRLENRFLKRTSQDNRSALSDNMIKAVLLHFPHSDLATLQTYTFERHGTAYSKAKADVEVFDKAGTLFFEGREFNSGTAVYWRPYRVSMKPEWPAAQLEFARQQSFSR